MHPIAGPAVEHELALKLENIFIEKEDDDGAKQQLCILKSSAGTRTNLVDTRDRFGSISIHAVAMSQNGALAKFLCKHSAFCLDVPPDPSSISTREMIQQQTFSGTKSFFKAKFDADKGRIVVYLATSTALNKW